MRSRGELSVEIACLRRELDLHLDHLLVHIVFMHNLRL